MENKQKYLEEITKILPEYLNEINSEKREINPQNFVEITDEILQLISLKDYQLNTKNTIINLCEQLHSIEEIMPHNYCLFTGRMRIIYTFLKVYESLLDEKYLMFAKSFFVKGKVMDYVTASQNSNGLLRGGLGTFIGILYLKKHAPSLDLEVIVDSIFDGIINNLAIDKYGLNNFYPEFHINSITNLASGNAGLIWFFTTISASKSRNENNKIINSFFESLNGQWSRKWSNWKDNFMKISSVDEHFNYIKQFENDNISFFNSPQNNHDYWQGSLGICTSLVNYLIQFSSKNSEILDRIETSLKSIEKTESNAFKSQNVKVFYYLYTSLFRITNDPKYELKAIQLLENSALKKSSKVALLHCILNGNDVNELDILPHVDSLEYVPKNLSKIIQQALILRYYTKTVNLLRHLEKKYFELNFLHNELNSKFYQNFETNFKNCSLVKANQHRKVLNDSFKLEQFSRKNIVKHQNKIFLKVQEIVQFSQANEVLNLATSEIILNEFLIADNIYLVETKWNWQQIDKMPLEEVFKIPSNNYYGLVKVKPNYEQNTVLYLSENQLIFLEIFYEKTSVKNAKASFLDNFDIKSEIEYENLSLFVDDTIEQFIFNRFIVLSE